MIAAKANTMAHKKLKLWFDKDLAKLLSKKIKTVDSDFNSRTFITRIDRQVDSLELKDRVEIIADELNDQLKGEYRSKAELLMSILGPKNENETGMFSDYYWAMPIAKFVEKYGLDDFNTSLKAIEEITQRNTGEYAIRPYLVKAQGKTLKRMIKWSKHSNSHVRRLASEGGRPRLPWASKLDSFIEDPRPLLPILEQLKDDPSKYVQKSVANCINDILKDNYSIGQELIDQWLQQGLSSQCAWIIKHSLRVLRKKKDSWALNIKIS